jgi:hypothetical protein
MSEVREERKKHINELQTPELRRDKYRYCRAVGLSSNQAHTMRDWPMWMIKAYVRQHPPVSDGAKQLQGGLDLNNGPT